MADRKPDTEAGADRDASPSTEPAERQHHLEKAEEYRSQAASCAETVNTTKSLKEGAEARRKQQSYRHLAENEAWLADNSAKLVEP